MYNVQLERVLTLQMGNSDLISYVGGRQTFFVTRIYVSILGIDGGDTSYMYTPDSNPLLSCYSVKLKFA